MKTLGIETSCDETAIAIYDSENGIIGESVFSQIKMHAEYGGVVPELASRDHCVKIVTVLEEALGDIDINSIDQIAYTSGPGLLGALLIGESFAQGLSTALKIPILPINHLEVHLMSPVMEFPEIQTPYISLLVSGGHSMIVDVKERGQYEILGQSQDDAVGEAFDKVGKWTTSLEELYLSDNGLSGTISSRIGSFSRLKNLHLSRNKVLGSFPLEMYDLAQLRTLHLENNAIDGVLSPRVVLFSRLEILNMQDNEMEGSNKCSSSLDHCNERTNERNKFMLCVRGAYSP